MPEIRLAVIGVGYLGKFHAEKYARMDNVKLTAVVDIQQSRAQEVAAMLGTRAYTDYRKLRGAVDAVSIAVPTAAHFDVGRFFLSHDVDVLVEKPITTSLEQADELIRIAESRGCILQVGHLERFNPAVVALKDIVHNPMFIEAHRLSIYKGRSTDISVVLDLMIHDIDIIMTLVNSGIKSIHAAGAPVVCRHADIANARLEFDSGCVANVTASRISIKNQRKIRLFQKDTYVSVDFAARDITIIGRAGGNGDGLIPGMDIRQLSFSEADALEDELAAYIQAVATRQTPPVPGQAGRKALQVALEIMNQINAAIARYGE